MKIMITGLILWSLVHLIPSVTPSLKQSLKTRLGENGFKRYQDTFSSEQFSKSIKDLYTSLISKSQ